MGLKEGKENDVSKKPENDPVEDKLSKELVASSNELHSIVDSNEKGTKVPRRMQLNVKAFYSYPGGDFPDHGMLPRR